MTEVIKKGTAKRLSNLKYYIAGKTGTAQVSTAKGYLDVYNHFFIGYLFLEDKKYSIYSHFGNLRSTHSGDVFAVKQDGAFPGP